MPMYNGSTVSAALPETAAPAKSLGISAAQPNTALPPNEWRDYSGLIKMLLARMMGPSGPNAGPVPSGRPTPSARSMATYSQSPAMPSASDSPLIGGNQNNVPGASGMLSAGPKMPNFTTPRLGHVKPRFEGPTDGKQFISPQEQAPQIPMGDFDLSQLGEQANPMGPLSGAAGGTIDQMLMGGMASGSVGGQGMNPTQPDQHNKLANFFRMLAGH